MGLYRFIFSIFLQFTASLFHPKSWIVWNENLCEMRKLNSITTPDMNINIGKLRALQNVELTVAKMNGDTIFLFLLSSRNSENTIYRLTDTFTFSTHTRAHAHTNSKKW